MANKTQNVIVNHARPGVNVFQRFESTGSRCATWSTFKSTRATQKTGHRQRNHWLITEIRCKISIAQVFASPAVKQWQANSFFFSIFLMAHSAVLVCVCVCMLARTRFILLRLACIHHFTTASSIRFLSLRRSPFFGWNSWKNSSNDLLPVAQHGFVSIGDNGRIW